MAWRSSSRASATIATELGLRYGTNPHQGGARATAAGGLPFTVLHGAPGYINLLDALNGWQLVRELQATLGLPAAASFKHVSPAGAALGLPLSAELRAAYFVPAGEALSPLAAAYARARGADRVCSYGDWVALSATVDESTARLLRREVSDGVIAPGYQPAALEILRGKRGGAYTILQIDPAYAPPDDALESRTVFGVTLQQQRNAATFEEGMLQRVVTAARDVPPAARRDMLVALITLKYTQSNSVCFVTDGQVIGSGAGQQSRIHCTRLAGDKADRWFLRQHPMVRDLPFRMNLGRVDRDNAIDGFLRDDLTSAEEAVFQRSFEQPPRRLTAAERRAWLSRWRGVTMGSDAFLPFRDNVDRAAASGVAYIVQPGGALRDADIVAACDAYGIAMVETGVRLFHH